MRVEIAERNFKDVDTAVALALYEDDWSSLSFLEHLEDQAKKILEVEKFKGKEDTVVKLHLVDGQKVRIVYVAGLGKKDRVGQDEWRRAFALCVKRAKKDKVSELYMYAGDKPSYEVSKAVTEGAVLGSYSFDKYKTKRRKIHTKV